MQFNDPVAPTAHAGSTPDRAIYKPGYRIPFALVRPGRQGRLLDTDAEGPLYPVIVLPRLRICGRFPTRMIAKSRPSD